MPMNLTTILPASRIRDRLIDRIAYANDASYFRLVPQAVVQPNSIGEIQSLFKFSQQNKIPMTFRAAGTSLSGQAVTDGILVDISKHWGEFSVEADVNRIRFQPGIVGGLLNNVLKPHGRRIGPDPASIDACMMGGILANNSSGMCCGTTENSYKTIHSMTFVLPNGFVLDTADPNANQIFENEQPQIAQGLLELKERVTSNPQLSTRIAKRYQIKNNNGYLLNAFLDFDSPLDILVHLLIGSEGTLGFIAEGVLHTLPDFTHKYTGQMYFKNIRDAAAAIYPIKQSGARAAEIMDRESLRAVENNAGVPAILKQLPNGAAAILVEYQAADSESMLQFKKEAQRVIGELKLIHDVEFTDDPIQQAALWKPRKGIIASVGAMRPRGTTSVNEDVAFPVEHLADAVTDLRHLFDDFGYAEGVIFGHAKDGNLHFLINQAFDTPEQINHFDNFMQAMVKIVSGKYDGSLKAEHGTGRNMAPFVETEWGSEAYSIMRNLKSLLDPDGMLNPNVLINDDPKAHVTHLKSLSLVAPEIDKCIECGFCEPKCPSRRLTLTPRQRIVVQRELASMRLVDSNSPEIDSVSTAYAYAGIDTCALDGLCGTACPVGIDTGKFIKKLREKRVTSNKSAEWIVENFGVAEKVTGIGVSLGHAAEKVIGVNGVKSISVTVEKITRTRLPKWNKSIPRLPKKLSGLRGLGGSKEFIYFPSCISRQLGVPSSSTSSTFNLKPSTCHSAKPSSRSPSGQTSIYKFPPTPRVTAAACPSLPRDTNPRIRPLFTKPSCRCGNGLSMENIPSLSIQPPAHTRSKPAAMTSHPKTKPSGVNSPFSMAWNFCTTMSCLNSKSTPWTKKSSCTPTAPPANSTSIRKCTPSPGNAPNPQLCRSTSVAAPSQAIAASPIPNSPPPPPKKKAPKSLQKNTAAITLPTSPAKLA
ncbi:MAG: FAD-binding oxidoreductase [Anaerolineales bacterium]|nr:FAD-binding oxidoreductase [Anaerolineales bacterium]